MIHSWLCETYKSLGSKSCLMGSLWYLPVFSIALLLVEFICYLLKNNVVSNNYIAILILSVGAVIMGYIHQKGIFVPFRIKTIFGVTLWVFIGYLSKENIMHFISNLNIWKIIVLAVLFIPLVALNRGVNISTPVYNDFVLFVATAAIGIVLTLAICRLRYLSFLEFFGRNSLIIFCMNSLWCEVYCMVLSKITGKQYIAMENVPLHFALLGTVFVLLISIPTFYIINPILKRLNRIITK